MSNNSIEAVLQESRRFAVPADFHGKLNLEDFNAMYKKSLEQPDAFWSEVAGELHWFKTWDTVSEWNEPHAKWFTGATTNISYNCLDRHLETRGDKVAIVWEGEPGDVRRVTYRELHAEVSSFSNVLKSLGIVAGDRVTIYLPMIPEAVVAMLACARIGANQFNQLTRGDSCPTNRSKPSCKNRAALPFLLIFTAN